MPSKPQALYRRIALDTAENRVAACRVAMERGPQKWVADRPTVAGSATLTSPSAGTWTKPAPPPPAASSPIRSSMESVIAPARRGRAAHGQD
jgi:hypothetical protein